MVPGRSYIVYLYVDNITGRCVATMKLKPYIGNEVITVAPHQKVDILVASQSPLGYRVIVASRHWGMIYRNQIFRPVAVGEQTEAYVTRITEDNRIDLSLQQEGYEGVSSSAENLLRQVREAGGHLEVGDDSTPDAIHACTRMSKKVFKRALGMLLKRGAVTTDGTSIRLKETK